MFEAEEEAGKGIESLPEDDTGDRNPAAGFSPGFATGTDGQIGRGEKEAEIFESFEGVWQISVQKEKISARIF